VDSDASRSRRLEEGAGTTYEALRRARGERLAALLPLPSALGSFDCICVALHATQI